MKRYLWIYILVTVFVAIWGIRALSHEPIVTQTVRSVEYENKINASGYIVREETVYKANSAGMAEAVYQNEERVAKGRRIATIYTDGIDEQTKQALDTLNAKIRRLEKKTAEASNVSVDLSSAEEKISASVAAVVEMTQTGNFEEMDLIQTEIAGYVHIGEGDVQVNPAKEALSDLYAQKTALEASVQSAKQDVYSTMAGIFVSETDGYEGSMTPQTMQSITVSDFKKMKIEHVAYVPESLNAGDRVCKIVDNTRWYFSAVLRTDALDALKVGSQVWLRFPEKSNDRVPAKIAHISPEENGEAVVLVSCSEYVEGIYSRREATCEIVTRVYDGFQIPQTAVRVDEEGNTGVFVNVSGMVHFRNIRILYRTDSTVIAAKSDENGYLKQYDAVIIGGKNIYAGAIVE